MRDTKTCTDVQGLLNNVCNLWVHFLFQYSNYFVRYTSVVVLQDFVVTKYISEVACCQQIITCILVVCETVFDRKEGVPIDEEFEDSLNILEKVSCFYLLIKYWLKFSFNISVKVPLRNKFRNCQTINNFFGMTCDA